MNWLKIPKRHWGFSYFVVVSLLTFSKLFDPAARGHYRVFTSAARAIWQGRPAYFTDFGWNTGLEWFYSPNCGLLFYLPFSFLPETPGVLLNVMAMWTAFVAGVFYFLRSVFTVNGERGVTPAPVFNFFWIVIASEMIGAIASQKTEILMIALCFFAAAELIRGRFKWPAFLLAMITNWKFQPLPLVGLFALTELFCYRDFGRRAQFAITFLVWSLVFLSVPILIFGLDATRAMDSAWLSAVQTQMQNKWIDFDHIYNVIRKVFGFAGVTLRDAHLLGAAAGAGFACLLAVHARMNRRSETLKLESLIFGFGLSAAFMTSFSPLSQSNGYILIAPLVAAAAIGYQLKAQPGFQRRVLGLALGLGWILTSLMTSDLVPRHMRNFWRENALKSIGPLVLASFAVWIFLKPQKNRVFSFAEGGADAI